MNRGPVEQDGVLDTGVRQDAAAADRCIRPYAAVLDRAPGAYDRWPDDPGPLHARPRLNDHRAADLGKRIHGSLNARRDGLQDEPIAFQQVCYVPGVLPVAGVHVGADVPSPVYQPLESISDLLLVAPAWPDVPHRFVDRGCEEISSGHGEMTSGLAGLF